MTSLELPPDNAQSLLKEIILEHGFENYEIHFCQATKKGDNYLGQIFGADIKKVKTEDDLLNLIVKCSTRNLNLRNTAPFCDLYTREVFMYKNVLPVFEKFEKEMGVSKPFLSYPKLYKYCTEELEEVLIMDNKKKQGYLMRERMNTLNFEDCKVVLQELGHLHSISFAMKNKNPKLFEELSKDLNDNLFHWFDKEVFSKQVHQMGEKAAMSVEENHLVYEKFNVFNSHIYETLMEVTSRESTDEYSIILHGDCWSNNLLFKDSDEENQPPAICFLDWQISQYGSPARDLAYFIYNCTGKELRNKNFNKLIQIYHNSLSEHLKEMGCDANVLFPFTALEQQMKKFFRYGLILASIAIYAFTSESEEIPDMQKTANENEKATLLDVLDFDSKHLHLYNERISGCIEHAVKQGYI